jgi:5-methylcytosine-specific restriction endonuclease McrA
MDARIGVLWGRTKCRNSFFISFDPACNVLAFGTHFPDLQAGSIDIERESMKKSARSPDVTPKLKRKAISNGLRFDIFKRDYFTCQYCSRTPPGVILEIDHIIPVKDGGLNVEGNLVTACAVCNSGKAAKSLAVIPESLSSRAKRIAESEAQIAGYAAVLQAKRDREDSDAWKVFKTLLGVNETRKDWFLGMTTILRKISVVRALEIADYTNGRGIYSDRHKFLYFCKVCWTEINGNATKPIEKMEIQ